MLFRGTTLVSHGRLHATDWQVGQPEIRSFQTVHDSTLPINFLIAPFLTARSVYVHIIAAYASNICDWQRSDKVQGGLRDHRGFWR